MLGGRLRDILTRVALIDICQLNVVAGHLLHRLRQFGHLRPLLLIRWRDDHGQQMAQGVHRDVGLRAPLPLVPVLSSIATTQIYVHMGREAGKKAMEATGL